MFNMPTLTSAVRRVALTGLFAAALAPWGAPAHAQDAFTGSYAGNWNYNVFSTDYEFSGTAPDSSFGLPYASIDVRFTGSGQYRTLLGTETFSDDAGDTLTADYSATLDDYTGHYDGTATFPDGSTSNFCGSLTFRTELSGQFTQNFFG